MSWKVFEHQRRIELRDVVWIEFGCLSRDGSLASDVIGFVFSAASYF